MARGEPYISWTRTRRNATKEKQRSKERQSSYSDHGEAGRIMDAILCRVSWQMGRVKGGPLFSGFLQLYRWENASNINL
jgi:hypothetical protein